MVGHSETGEMDKVDGPYYFFKLLQRARNLLPPVDARRRASRGKEINLVPVDFVAKAMDHIAHEDGLDGKVFHLTDPNPMRAGQIINLFARAAHAPEAAMRIDSKMLDVIPKQVRSGIQMLPPVKRITDQVLADLGIPRSVLVYINYPTSFDSTQHPEGARGDRHLGARRCRATPTSSGTTGSATSTPTCSRTAPCPARSAARPC